jgi:hypothetical protein
VATFGVYGVLYYFDKNLSVGGVPVLRAVCTERFFFSIRTYQSIS